MRKYLAPRLREIVEKLDTVGLEEIRVRLERPLMAKIDGEFTCLSPAGFSCAAAAAYLVTRDDVERTVQIITKNSWYAWQQEILNGYLTLPGGHRVGIGGQAVFAAGELKTVKNIASLNFRQARAVLNCADPVINAVAPAGAAQLLSTLIISPPGCGKTTLLRDLARQLANRGFQTVIIDERSEIAACYQGLPQLDVGFQTDVLDGYSKEIGVHHALRGLAPDVVITDEIGHGRDAWILAELARSGVKVVATCHGDSLRQVKTKSWARESLGVFETAVILSRRKGPGTVESVLRLPKTT